MRLVTGRFDHLGARRPLLTIVISRKPRDFQCLRPSLRARVGANDGFGSKRPFGRGVKPLCCGECQGASR